MADGSGKPGDLEALSALAPVLADMLGLVSHDVTLLLDTDGVIEKVVLGGTDSEALRSTSADWVGRNLQDTVTDATRQKVQELLKDATTKGVSRPRHINHSGADHDIPFTYTAVRLGKAGPLLAVGRDLRAVSAMQQRFISTQQEMERNYWKMRQTESRYRLLFQVATDAVLVIDPNTLKISDANDAAARLFGMTAEEMVGREPTVGIETGFASVVEGLLSTALTAGRGTEIRVRLARGGHAARVSAMPYITSGPTMLLLRVRLAGDAVSQPVAESRLMALFDRTQDAVVITDQQGSIVMGNPAFATLFEIDEAATAVGQSLGQWLGAADGCVPRTIADLVQNGVVPLFTAGLRTEKGRALQVELSATLLPDGDLQCVGFIMRARPIQPGVGSRAAGDGGSTRSLH